MKRLFLVALMGLMTIGVSAQRVTDKLDRGLVAVPGASGGNFVSWKIFGEEYYDVTYNLYRDGVLLAENLTTSNYQDAAGSSASSVVKTMVRILVVNIPLFNHNFLSVSHIDSLSRIVDTAAL